MLAAPLLLLSANALAGYGWQLDSGALLDGMGGESRLQLQQHLSYHHTNVQQDRQYHAELGWLDNRSGLQGYLHQVYLQGREGKQSWRLGRIAQGDIHGLYTLDGAEIRYRAKGSSWLYYAGSALNLEGERLERGGLVAGTVGRLGTFSLSDKWQLSRTVIGLQRYQDQQVTNRAQWDVAAINSDGPEGRLRLSSDGVVADTATGLERLHNRLAWSWQGNRVVWLDYLFYQPLVEEEPRGPYMATFNPDEQQRLKLGVDIADASRQWSAALGRVAREGMSEEGDLIELGLQQRQRDGRRWRLDYEYLHMGDSYSNALLASASWAASPLLGLEANAALRRESGRLSSNPQSLGASLTARYLLGNGWRLRGYGEYVANEQLDDGWRLGVSLQWGGSGYLAGEKP